MPTFTYKVKDGPVKSLEGEIHAVSRDAALAQLDAMGYIPVWVRERDDHATASGRKGRGRRIRSRDITVFTLQLASLTRSGVPILRALSTMMDQADNPRFGRLLEDIQHAIHDGGMLSDALTRHPAHFPSLYVNMVRSGESGGRLETVLQRLAESREKEEDLRRKVQSALAYPLLILSAGLVTIVILFAFFLPRVVALFAEYDDLPLPTRLLIGATHFFSTSWYWLVLVLILGGAILRRLAAFEKTRMLVDRIRLHLPLFGRFIRYAETARFARTLALLIDAGLPIDRALAFSGATLRNAVMQAEIEGVANGTITQGASLASGLRRTRWFGAFVANMVGVGEEAGRLDDALNEIASFFEKEVDQQNRLMTSLLEPLMILGVGLIVGFIVAAMLLPIFEIGTRF